MNTAVSPKDSLHRPRLQKFMRRPQRHRLLHGFPLAAAMPYADEQARRRARANDPQLSLPGPQPGPLLIGVLPHPFCNPKVKGCGYCTFPHEQFSRHKSTIVAQAVSDEIAQRLTDRPEWEGTSVTALYFGGGTANLTPPDSFRLLARSLSDAFDLSNAEVSLEGVPGRFLHGQPQLWDVMQEELDADHFRISMGIQTFDDSRLEQMGRLAFGRPHVFASVVEEAHRRNITVSGDLLFNLPAQSCSEMLDDARRAIEIGLDQICLYHLVMFRGLGTAWSRDEEKLARLPDNEEAAANWLRLRELLLCNGYRQTSLTNFELRKHEAKPQSYRYESVSYHSDRCQVLGFGPGGISFSATQDREHGLKTLNPESSAEYVAAVRSQGNLWNRYFQYGHEDLAILHLTRRLAALKIDKAEFTERFGALAFEPHLEKLGLLVDENLLSESRTAYRLTPRGMFFSDSIAALLADGRLHGIRKLPMAESHNSNSGGHM